MRVKVIYRREPDQLRVTVDGTAVDVPLDDLPTDSHGMAHVVAFVRRQLDRVGDDPRTRDQRLHVWDVWQASEDADHLRGWLRVRAERDTTTGGA